MSGFIRTINDLLLHESEYNHGEKSDSIFFEQPSTDPLVNGVANVFDEFINTGFILDGCSLDGFEEEEVE
jgi:hypothetical protein